MRKLIIFTDLDGTLLDHENYGWSDAEPALKKLSEDKIPVILNSSKTFSEMKQIADQLRINQPLICENGSLVAMPVEPSSNDGENFHLEYFALAYPELIKVIQGIREEYQFKFIGFYDMDIADIQAATGLNLEAATQAANREATEPLIWQDSDKNLSRFQSLLEQQKLTITRGGRFYHVMSPVNKSQAMNYVVEFYQNKYPQFDWVTMALGDSVNDLSMLESVDYPALVLNLHSAQPDVTHISNIIKTDKPGPTGWNQAVLSVLENI